MCLLLQLKINKENLKEEEKEPASETSIHFIWWFCELKSSWLVSIDYLSCSKRAGERKQGGLEERGELGATGIPARGSGSGSGRSRDGGTGAGVGAGWGRARDSVRLSGSASTPGSKDFGAEGGCWPWVPAGSSLQWDSSRERGDLNILECFLALSNGPLTQRSLQALMKPLHRCLNILGQVGGSFMHLIASLLCLSHAAYWEIRLPRIAVALPTCSFQVVGETPPQGWSLFPRPQARFWLEGVTWGPGLWDPLWPGPHTAGLTPASCLAPGHWWWWGLGWREKPLWKVEKQRLVPQ